jgi:hypothetical protein
MESGEWRMKIEDWRFENGDFRMEILEWRMEAS